MTKTWNPSHIKEYHTDAYIVTSNWELEFDDSLGVAKWIPTAPFQPAIVEIKSDHLPDDYFDASSMIVISDHLKQLLEDFKVHAEYLPIQVTYKGEKNNRHKFYCCNILKAVDCLDLKQGEYTFHQKAGFIDHIDKIKKLAIDENKAAPYHLFRIAKGAEYIVCVSDALADKIEQLQLTGSIFVKPEDWTFCKQMDNSRGNN